MGCAVGILMCMVVSTYAVLIPSRFENRRQLHKTFIKPTALSSPPRATTFPYVYQRHLDNNLNQEALPPIRVKSSTKSSNGGKRKALGLANVHKNVMPHARDGRMLPDERKAYNSYKQFNPGQYEEGSPEWQMAMIRYLLDMKN